MVGIDCIGVVFNGVFESMITMNGLDKNRDWKMSIFIEY